MTEMEKKVEAALEAYFDKFGKPYPLGWGNAPTQEQLIAEIETAIKNNEPVPEPIFDPEADY